jgi:hypothetical protein
MVFSIWIAGGIQEIVDILSSNRKLSQPAIFWRCCWQLHYQIFSTIPTVDASKDAGRNIWDSGHAILFLKILWFFTGDDESTFALWYFILPLNQRPDITVFFHRPPPVSPGINEIWNIPIQI